eukprot:c49031_g1_i1 orf=360-542(-)
MHVDCEIIAVLQVTTDIPLGYKPALVLRTRRKKEEKKTNERNVCSHFGSVLLGSTRPRKP